MLAVGWATIYTQLGLVILPIEDYLVRSVGYTKVS